MCPQDNNVSASSKSQQNYKIIKDMLDKTELDLCIFVNNIV